MRMIKFLPHGERSEGVQKQEAGKEGKREFFVVGRGGEERRDFSVDFTWTDAESRKNVATDKRKSRDKS